MWARAQQQLLPAASDLLPTSCEAGKLRTIEDLFLRPPVKKAIILLLYLADIKALKDAVAR